MRKNDSTQEGHRKRLRQKFLKSGLDGFHDYEIVELLLTLATPRRDCKATAKKALKQFGSLRGVLEAPAEELATVYGIGPNNVIGLKLAQAIALRYLNDKVIGKDFLRSSEEVVDYLRLNLRDRTREVFLVVFLNGRNQITAMEELFAGTLTTSAVYPREVIDRTLKNKAAALVLVHNHPSGSPQPSKEDLDITKRLKDAAASIDVTIHDHIIIAGDTFYSFADHGML